MRENYLQYASYVILDRAIPDIVDGLKPVQRRILHTLSKIDDGRMHKVANVVGQTMAYHPHGDAAIGDALINMAQKDFLLDKQGNFGNPYTGDPAAAVRYIETRLSSLAKATLFNPDLTEFVPSYDGRNQEPVALPAKLPLVLLHGAEGIAVGMSTRILPHNFCELLEAQIAHLQGKSYELLPDFALGGIMDASTYDKGRGKVRLRAKLNVVDDKTIAIEEICYGTTTESVMRSIEEAAKRGKLKIESIHDYTAEKVEIEIKLPRGQHATDLIQHLYAFTECEVSLNAMCLVIKDHLPWETDVDSILEYHTSLLQGYLKKELEIEQARVLRKIYDKTLEQIFIENRLYKQIETVKSAEKVDETVKKSLIPYHSLLSSPPEKEDRERLLSIPIRRISLFDIEKNRAEIASFEERLQEIEKHLKQLKRFTTDYLKELLKTYGSLFPRRTVIEHIEQVDKRAIAAQKVKVGFDPQTGFIGTKISSDSSIECTNFDKLLLISKEGTYRVVNVPEKLYANQDDTTTIYVGVADKKTLFRALYIDEKSKCAYVKRFVVDKFILERTYPYLPEEARLEFLTTDENVAVEIEFKANGNKPSRKLDFPLDQVPVKGVKARGIRMHAKPVKKVKILRPK
ncbi:MAG: DNA topoisomerase IV subunit A [Verrucomicrobia bacterium]|nr:DNA topoisomerase IV subunit A [Verrucomicrobiota bacterium]